MARTPAKRAEKSPAKKAPAKKASPVRLAARKVAADAEQVRVDVGQLLSSLDHLGVAALRQVAERATVLIDEKTEGEKRTFIEEVTARAMSLGVSITDLFGKSGVKTGKVVKAVPGKSDGGKRASPPVKYRDPQTGAGWSGRGRPARWLADYEAQGRKRDEFAV
jgi:DNA-binding protein H-NS